MQFKVTGLTMNEDKDEDEGHCKRLDPSANCLKNSSRPSPTNGLNSPARKDLATSGRVFFVYHFFKIHRNTSKNIYIIIKIWV